MSTILSKLFEVQAEIPDIQKDKIGQFQNSYVSLDTVLDAVLPVFQSHGLVLLQSPTNVNGLPALRTIIADAETGESVEDVMMLVLEKDNSQGLGSAITYAKRYALLSTLALTADEDDDGRKASTPAKVKNPAIAQLASVKDQAESSVPVF